MSPFLRLRKSHVILAEARIRDFSTSIRFGVPVLPLVFTSMRDEDDRKSDVNSSKVKLMTNYELLITSLL